MLSKAPFKIAKLQALKSTSRFRVGCVLAKKNKILSIGYNHMNKTHPMTSRYSQHARLHAEIDACIGLRPYDVRGCDAFVVRLKMNESYAMSRPCPMCRAVLRKMGIRSVYYSTENTPFWQKEKL